MSKEAEEGTMFNANFDRKDTGPAINEANVDRTIAAAQQAPICCRCGAQIQGVPMGQVVRCPRCHNMMRHVGSMWLEYVSPLEIPKQDMPAAVRNINGWRR